jgi:hypothetical protein
VGTRRDLLREQDRKTDGAEKAVRQKDKKRTVKQAWNGRKKIEVLGFGGMEKLHRGTTLLIPTQFNKRTHTGDI